MSSPQLSHVDTDPRFTVELVFDLIRTMQRHGYERPADVGVLADTMSAALKLTRAYEGVPE